VLSSIKNKKKKKKMVVIIDAGSLFLGKNQVLGIEGVSVTY
jgi:hypothetical protein